MGFACDRMRKEVRQPKPISLQSDGAYPPSRPDSPADVLEHAWIPANSFPRSSLPSLNSRHLSAFPHPSVSFLSFDIVDHKP